MPFVLYVLFVALVGDLSGGWHATEAVDVLEPILSELLVDDAVTARGVIEAVFVSNNADVCQTTEEYERSKLELLFDGRRCETDKQVTSTHSFKADPGRLENTPNKP